MIGEIGKLLFTDSLKTLKYKNASFTHFIMFSNDFYLKINETM